MNTSEPVSLTPYSLSPFLQIFVSTTSFTHYFYVYLFLFWLVFLKENVTFNEITMVSVSDTVKFWTRQPIDYHENLYGVMLLEATETPCILISHNQW
jgi:hypothetical protein